MRFKSAVPVQLSDDPSPWQRPEPPPFRPPAPAPNRSPDAPPFRPPEPPPFKRPEPPPWGPWFRSKVGGIREWLRRVALPTAVVGLTLRAVQRSQLKLHLNSASSPARAAA